MSFRDCLRSAQEQGVITAAEAKDLGDRFDRLRAAAAKEGGDPSSAAKATLETQLRHEAERKRRLATLTEQARARIVENIMGYRNSRGEADIVEGVLSLFEHYGFRGYESVDGKAKSIIGMAHAEMEEALHQFDRTFWLGKRRNKARLENVVRELYGEGTGDASAKAIADAFGAVSEKLRQRFNAGGGEIARLKGWGMPQFHDPVAVIRAGRDQWKAAIRPRLDPERMVDPLTGGRVTAERLEELLDGSYDSIVTNGDIRLTPSSQAQGRGALANQRGEHRLLVFKTADDWLAYSAAFGQGDPFVAMMNHIKGMARDIAALEVLGPNPSATVEWLRQVVKLEAAKATTGIVSSFVAKNEMAAQSRAAIADWHITSVWSAVRGGNVVNEGMAAGASAIRQVVTSAVLGSAVLTAVPTDPMIANMAKRLSGMPTRNWLSEVIRTFFSDSREAVRAGLVLEDAIHGMGQDARYAGTLAGPVWARYLADRTTTVSGLNPWTQRRKHVFGMDFQAFLANHQADSWDALPERLRRTMTGYGITEKDWGVIASAEVYEPKPGATWLRPVDIARVEGGRAAAEKVLGMILSETERAVPSGTKRSTAWLTGGTEAGTIGGEVLRSMTQFKSFGLSFTMLQLEAMARETADYGKAAGAAYAGSLLLGLTVMGGLALQLKQLPHSKDLMDMSDPRFWLQAAATGGGFGLFGDFLFADVNRMGHSLGQQLMGPLVQTLGDVLKLPAGNLQRLFKGEETSLGEDLVDFGRRYMPTASVWYMRAAYNRVLFDQLQYLADPEAHRNLRDKEKRLRRDTGQEFWWKPGELLPSRLPRASSAP